MNTENMNTRQLLNYAKDNGYNTVKFICRKNGKMVCVGEFLDAYYEFIKIPVLGDGFVSLDTLEEERGYDIMFDVLTDEMYKTYVQMDFMLRGKEIPKQYAS